MFIYIISIYKVSYELQFYYKFAWILLQLYFNFTAILL